MRDWKGVILHHSATKDNPEAYDWGAIRKYHINTKGWNEIGYHFGLELEKRKVEFLKGRSLSLKGAHTKGFNETHIGICVLGNWDLKPPPSTILFFLESFIRELQRVFKFSQDEVLGHWETFLRLGKAKTKEEAWRIKTCPGKLFPLGEVRKFLLPKPPNSRNSVELPYPLDLS